MEETKQLTDKTPAQIENEAIEGNEIIAAWLGWIRREPGEYNLPNWWEPDMNDLRLKCKFRGYPNQIKFHSSWDWLMPALKKWDDLPLDDFDLDSMQEYMNLCDKLDHLVSCYEIIPAYTHFVKCIKWYSNQPQKAS
jgi:hypothetical protein